MSITCFKSNAQNYNIKYFNIKDGLVGANINQVFQDSKGFIWFAADGGISKFDGKRFINYTKKEGLISNTATCVKEDAKGNIWIGTDEGLSCFDGYHFTNYTKINGLMSNTIRSIYIDLNKAIWVVTENGGVSKFESNRFVSLAHNSEKVTQNVYAITEDKKGNIWLATSSGILRYDGNRFVNFYHIPEVLDKSFFSILLDSKGTLWFGGTKDNGVLTYDGSSFKKFDLPKDVQEDFIGSISEDQYHNILFATDHGVLKFDGLSTILISESNGLSSNIVQSIFCDNENNIWIGTLGGGVNLFNNESFVSYNEKQGLSTKIISCTLRDQANNLLVGTLGFGVNILEGNKFKPVQSINDLISSSVFSINQNSKGEYWIGTDKDGVLVFEYTHNSFRLKKRFFSQESNQVNAVIKIIFDDWGNTWIGCYGSGLFVIDEKYQVKNYSKKTGFISDNILTLFKASNGAIWIGTLDAGVAKLENNKFTNYNVKSGLVNKEVWSIAEDDKQIMFFGTREGLSSFDGSTFKNFDSGNGICSNFIETIHWDDIEKCLWLGTDKGINKIKLDADLNIKRPIKYYGNDEGFSGIEVNQNAFYMEKNGVIWLGTNSGLFSYNRKFDLPNNIPPNLYLNEVMLAYKTVDWSKYATSVDRKTNIPKNLSLSYLNNHLTFKFQAITTDKVKYTHMLEGQDKDWSPLSENNEADFTNITPGRTYIFKVKAINSNGKWSNEILTFSFKINAPWYANWWAYCFYFITVISSIIIFVRYRISSLKKRQIILEETVDKRTNELQLEKILVEKKNAEILSSIEYAKRIQSTILPPLNDIKQYIPNSFVLYIPKDIVAGDFYWMKTVEKKPDINSNISENLLLIAVCDSTGHGVPGALVSIVCSKAMDKAVKEFKFVEPSLILDKVAEIVIEDFSKNNEENDEIKDGMDVSLLSINKTTNELQWAGANNGLIIIDPKGELVELKPDKQPIGKSDSINRFTNHTFKVERGSCLYLFSDGFADQFGGPSNKKYQRAQLKELLISNHTKNMQHQYENLLGAFNAWKGINEQVDDVCIIGIKL